MIVILIEIALKLLDFGLSNAKTKSRFKKVLLGFLEQHDAGVKKNVKLKRRYDELMDKLRSNK